MVIGVALTTCRLDKLLSGPAAAIFCEHNGTLTISAANGSETPQSNSFLVANCGDGSLNWSAEGHSPWLTLVPDSGEASTSGTTVNVQANPHGMAPGTYTDTVDVNGVSVSTQIRIPVQFIIHDCTQNGIVADQIYSDTLNAADCAAPHRTGAFAQIFRYQGTANDVVSIEVNSAFDGYVALDTSLTPSKPPLAASDDCIGQAGSPCLPYLTLPSDGQYFVEVTSHAPADTGLFTVEIAHPRPPNDPDSLDQRLDLTRSIPVGNTIGQNSVILRAIVSDPDLADTIHLEAEVVPNNQGFSSANYVGSDTVLNGQPAHVSVTGLTNHIAYHWRVRAVDQTGRTSNWVAFGGNPDFIVSISQPPLTPSNLSQYQADSTSPIGIGGTGTSDTVVLAGQVSDPDPGDMVRLLVEVKPVGQAFSPTPTATDSSAPVSGAGAGSIAKVRIGPLANNTNYHWRAWAEDQTGRLSGTLSFGGNSESATDFRIQVAHPPDAPAALGQFQADLTPLPTGGTANQGSVVFQGTVSDIDAGTVRLEVEVEPIGTPFDSVASGTSNLVASGQVASLSLSSPTIQNGVCYHWQARAVDNTNRGSGWGSYGGNLETVNDFCVALPVSNIAFTVNPQPSVQAGVAFAPALQVTARNSLNQTVTSFTGAVTITILNNAGPGGTLFGTATQNAVLGVAQFPGLSIDKLGNGYTLQASAAGFTAPSTAFNITPGPVAKLAYSVQPSSAASGATITPAVRVQGQDAFGNLVNTFTGNVSLAITSGTGTAGAVLTGGSPIPAVGGEAIFSGLSINKSGANYTLTASSGILTQAVSAPFSITGGTIASLSFSQGPPTNTTAGAAITPVQVTALDGGGNVANFNGNITIGIGTNPVGGAFTGTSQTTVAASGGVANFPNLHIQKAGAGYTLTASASGAPTIPSNPFNIVAGTTNLQLVFTTQPATTADSAIIDSVGGVVVTAFDSTGVNIATSFTGQVRMSITPGTGTSGAGLFGTVNKNASGGIAQFTDLRINKLGTAYQLTATATGLLSDDSSPFDIIVGPAKVLVFTVEPPASTVANVAMNPAVKVTVRDAAGNTVTGFGGQVSLAITSGTGTAGAVLSGGTANASLGVATFSNLSIDRAGAGYSLTASSGALTQDVSTPFTILAGGPSGPNSSISPTSPITACKVACSGGSLSTVTVTARDAANNPVAGATVTISSSSPSAVVTQPAGLTNGSGVTTGTISDTTAGPQTVSATITLNPNPPVSPTAANLTVNPAAAAAVFFIRNPLTTAAGATINNPGTGIQVQINDQFGNKVNGATNSVGLSILVPPSPAGGVLSGAPNPKAAVGGVATFTTLSIAQANTNYVLLASSAGLPVSDTSTAFNINAGVATQLSITTQPSTSAQSGIAIPQQPAIQLLDASNNPVSQSGVVITATINSPPGGSSLTNATATTNGSGLATFSGLAISGPVQSYTLHFASGSLTAANSNSIALSAGAASKLSITTQPSSSAQSGVAFGQQPVIQVVDAANNPVSQSGISVTATINSGGGAIGGTTSASTNGSGVATFLNLSIAGTIGNRTLHFAATVPPLTGVNSATINLTAGPMTKLVFTTQPATTTAGQTIGGGSGVVVTAEDAQNNVVTTFGGSVSIAITSGSGTTGATLSGTSPVTASSGVAQFSDLSIDSAGTNYTLRATSGGFNVTSTAFNINAGAVAQLEFTSQPTDAAANTNISPAVVVTAKDAIGNIVTSFTGNVDMTIGVDGALSPPATLGGTTTKAAVAGVATFSDLQIDQLGSGYKLQAAVGAVTALSAAFNIL